MTELTPEQHTVIEIILDTAPDIQDDLKTKFGYGENIFFYNDLVEYRINNSREDIAEDLDLEERYNLINNQPRETVGRAFRGHHNKDFFPEYQFNGLLGKETNDMIEGQRKSKGGLIGGRASVETHGDQMRNGYANSLANLTPKERIENSRIGGLKGGLIGGRNKRGRGYWQTHPELLEEICELRNEGLSWKDTTDEFNRRHNTEYKSGSLSTSYQNNKHLLADEEE